MGTYTHTFQCCLRIPKNIWGKWVDADLQKQGLEKKSKQVKTCLRVIGLILGDPQRAPCKCTRRRTVLWARQRPHPVAPAMKNDPAVQSLHTKGNRNKIHSFRCFHTISYYDVFILILWSQKQWTVVISDDKCVPGTPYIEASITFNQLISSSFHDALCNKIWKLCVLGWLYGAGIPIIWGFCPEIALSNAQRDTERKGWGEAACSITLSFRTERLRRFFLPCF